jgi:hypothetical protein
MDSVRAQKIPIVNLHRLSEIIDLKTVAYPNGPSEDALHAPFIERVICGEQIQAVVAKAIEPGVPDMHDVSLTPPQDECCQRAGHTLKIGIAAADGMDPAIHRLDSTRAFLSHAEELTLAEVTIDEAPYHGLGCHATTLGPTDPVRDSRHRAMARPLRGRAIEESAIVLIVGSRAFLCRVAHGDTELPWRLLVERHAAP